MAFTKIAAAGIGSTGTVTLENLVVTGGITAALSGTASSTTNIPNLSGAIISSNTTTSLGSFSSANLATALTNKTGSGENVFATGPTLTTVTVSSGGINVTGVSTLGNTVIGGGTTQLVVTGNARITGILTIGTSSITLDGSNNQLNVGTGVTLHHTNGVQVGGNTLHSTGLTLNSLTATGVSTFTNGPVLVGTATSTGTASQPLQVTGGAYVSGNLGIGTTNPIAKLQVIGSTELSELNLSGISSSISSTAVDVFVYDTRKDSDGGAWRKRTQHTSWYNETLNTATRGARREFPAVAIIVIEGTNTGSSKIKIYDGDDPDMPLWMIFNGSAHTTFSDNSITSEGSIVHPVTLTSVFALNGAIAITSANYILYLPNFISDVNIINVGEFGSYTGGFASYSLPISGRNSSGIYFRYSTQKILANGSNDVAMTVLPNAPIDPSTGLPVPTIAVACGPSGSTGGISVINDNGSVSNVTLGSNVTVFTIRWIDNTRLYAGSIHISGVIGFRHYILNYPSLTNERIEGASYEDTGLNWSTGQVAGSGDGIFGNRFATIKYGFAIGYANVYVGLNLINYDPNPNAGLFAYIKSNYNTGWMHGDIKGAFLSDTSTASVTGTELNQYGNFASTTGWESRSASWTVSGGVASVSSGAGYQLLGSTSGTLTNGRKYAITVNVTVFTAGRLEVSQTNSSNVPFNLGSTGIKTLIFTYTGLTGYALGIYGYGDASYGFTIDDLHIIELSEPDRSVNNTGLAVYGTITKTAVATGSNLVGYSGFDSSNYLYQPYNSALDFGTGDFCYMCWVKDDSVSAGACIFQRGAAVNSNETVLYIQSDMRLIGRIQQYSDQVTSNICFVEGQWNFVVFQRRGSTVEIYHNGVLQGSITNTQTTTQVGQELSIGSWRTNNIYFPTSISLFRVSASSPSPSQILKIYNDEKTLFHPGAQATLFGSSDAVTALAYDDTTNLLSVGTSFGRSDFSGLKRINNTTTAVTTTISASNGLIAEQ